MDAKNDGRLDGKEDGGHEFDTTTLTVGDSRKSAKKRKRPSTSQEDLNLNETAGSSRDVTKAPTYSDTLPKNFFDEWSSLADTQLPEVRELVDRLLANELTMDGLKQGIRDLKGMTCVQDSLLTLAVSAYESFNSNSAQVTQLPAYVKLQHLKTLQFEFLENWKLQHPAEELDTEVKQIEVPYYQQNTGCPIPYRERPACARTEPLPAGEPEPVHWGHVTTYSALVAEIDHLELAMTQKMMPDPQHDWDKFCEYFPGWSSAEQLKPLLKVRSA
jgi:hypothetical protein